MDAIARLRRIFILGGLLTCMASLEVIMMQIGYTSFDMACPTEEDLGVLRWVNLKLHLPQRRFYDG
jgi:hypothetical protein